VNRLDAAVGFSGSRWGGSVGQGFDLGSGSLGELEVRGRRGMRFCLTIKLLDNRVFVANCVSVAARGLVRRGASACRRGCEQGWRELKKRVARALFNAGVSAQ
jgi:hypothetical protein